jgi:hypothetical protein
MWLSRESLRHKPTISRPRPHFLSSSILSHLISPDRAEDCIHEIMALCFLQALAEAKRRENNIAEQEYIEHLVAHFRGIRHSEDSIASVGDTLAAIEPWAGSLREVALASTYGHLQGTIMTYLAPFTSLHRLSSRHISVSIPLFRVLAGQYRQFQNCFTRLSHAEQPQSLTACRLSCRPEAAPPHSPLLPRRRRCI